MIMIVISFLLLNRVASQSAAELLEDLSVHLTQHHSAMHLATSELGQLRKSKPAVLIVL